MLPLKCHNEVTKKTISTMKVSKNILTAKEQYPSMFHVVSQNEVHSFEKHKDALEDYEMAVLEDEKRGLFFEPYIECPKTF
jgi:dTDP-4-dehydrorhamnose reductase